MNEFIHELQNTNIHKSQKQCIRTDFFFKLVCMNCLKYNSSLTVAVRMLLLNSVAAVQPSPHSQLIGWKSAMMSSQNVIRAPANSLGATLNVTLFGRVTVCERG